MEHLLNKGEDRGRAGTPAKQRGGLEHLLNRGEDRGRAGTPAKDRKEQGMGWNTF